MTRAGVLALSLAVVAGVATAWASPAARRKRPAPELKVRPLPPEAVRGVEPAGSGPAAGEGTQTRCALCHRTSDWLDVRFNHDPTGFPLKGAHRRVTCKACHPSGFKARIAETCAGCHRDPHAATFGQQCDGCHDEESWATSFTVDAHRQTNFPLSGRHAMIPCRECHPQARDRVFARSPVLCVSCHLADYQRAAMTTIDHEAAAFSTDCRQCHTSLRFRPARLAEHERCFSLSGGPHAGIRCNNCHVGPVPISTSGACNTNSATCTACHEHSCGRSDRRHTGIAGYECRDRKCYECHRFAR